MLKSYEIREIIQLFNQSTLQEIQVKSEEYSIILKNDRNTRPFNETNLVPTREIIPIVESISTNVVNTLQNTKNLKPQVNEIIEQQNSSLTKPVSLEDETIKKIVSPMVGTFYAAPSENGLPFVKVGDTVDISSIICIVEAMKLFNEIEADIKGEVVKVLVQNGQLVEQGQPLFLIKPY